MAKRDAKKSEEAPKVPKPETNVPLWTPHWRWHLKALVIIYIVLAIAYFVINTFLTRVPEPYRMRDIPKEMTPWLKK